MGVKNLWQALERGGAVETLDGAVPAQLDAILAELEDAVVAVDASAWCAAPPCVLSRPPGACLLRARALQRVRLSAAGPLAPAALAAVGPRPRAGSCRR
jgi:hypothetical protein